MTIPGPGLFSVLVVCTGNLCRSPQAAQLLQVRADAADEKAERARSHVEIASAGTHALLGASMDPHAAELSRVYGGSPEGHVAQQLCSAMVEAADLVLCMTREHRSAVVRQVPQASRRTFLLTEFAALLEDFSQRPGHPECPPDVVVGAGSLPAQLRAGVEAAAGRRGQIPRGRRGFEEVIDPYRGEASAYRESAAQIHRAVERIDQAVAAIRQEAER